MMIPPVVFADTSYYLAALWSRDSRHSQAAAWQKVLSSLRIRTLTTEAVLWELLNSLSHRSVRATANAAYQRVRSDSSIEVIDFDSGLITSAMQLYRTVGDKDWGITDCLSFTVMRQRGVTHALTSDHHFEQAGFAAMLLEDPPL